EANEAGFCSERPASRFRSTEWGFANRTHPDLGIADVVAKPSSGPLTKSAWSARPLATLTGSPPSDTEIPVQISGPSRELVPSPRPRPLDKSRPARVHKMRNLPHHVSN